MNMNDTVNSTTARQRVHRPNGKVARLPLEMRNLVNQALRDGRTYRQIIGLLAAQGFPGFNPQNLSSWSRRGYRAWLAVQERFEAKRPLSEKAQAILGQLNPDGRSSLADLNESMLAVYFQELLEGCDVSNFAGNSEDFLRVAKALASVMSARAQRQHADLQRLQYELDLRKIERAEEARVRAKKGISPDIMRQIEAAAKLL